MTSWLSQYRKGKLQPGHQQAQPTAAEAELRRLREENKRLEMEVAILKKASAYRSLEPEGRQSLGAALTSSLLAERIYS